MDEVKQHIDSKFIDQSWQNMSELLDKEMPVQKPKKRFFWLWFLGLSALIISASAYYYRLGFQKDIIPKVTPKKIEKIAQKETVTVDTQINSKEKRTANTENKKLNQYQYVPEKKLDKQIKSRKSSRTVASKANPKLGNLKGLIQKNPFFERRQTTANSDKILQTTIVPAEIKANYQKWSSHNIFRLPILPFSRFHKERPTEVMPIINPVKKKPLKWRFGLYIGGLANNFGGYRAGLHSNLVLNPKWRLHIGLGYAHRIQNNFINGNEVADILFTNDDNTETSDDEDIMLPSAPTIDSIPNTNEPEVNELEQNVSNQLNLTKFHYFELPIVFQYQFKPRWTLDFGGQIALLHGFNYERAGVNNFTTDLATFSSPSTRAISLNRTTINTINFAAIGGISYQITPKLSAYSSYLYSSIYLTNNSINTVSNKRWQQIEVGIKYYFK